ncbi:phosphotransferase [Chloroflexi bacterium TSY]|nr:phosphotransferase [Chloroflexi bacterium TSY]
MAEQSETPADNVYLSAIDKATLTPIVRRALNRETTEIADWTYRRVYGGAGDVGEVLSGVYRFAGKGRDQDKSIEWSLILKVVGTTADDDPADPRYWKREVLAYQSGQLADLPGSLAAPRFLGITEFFEKVVGLWLEELVDDVGLNWPLEHYGLVARHLGQFNGTFLANQELPCWPWLLRDRLQHLVHGKQAGRKFDQLRASLGEPQTHRWFINKDDANSMLQLWEERGPLLDALYRLPQTVVHGDAFRRNLFARRTQDGHDETVAVDWTFVGMGAIGLELASLVQGTLFFSEVDVAQARTLDRIVFEGYLTGLSEAGWHGDPRQVRLGYTASSAMIFGLGYSAFKLNQDVYPWLEQAFGLPIDQFMDLGAELNRFFLELADEARTLLHVVPFLPHGSG